MHVHLKIIQISSKQTDTFKKKIQQKNLCVGHGCPLRTLNLCALFNTYNMLWCIEWANKMNQHPLAHHEGWMVRGQETSFLLGSSSLSNHG